MLMLTWLGTAVAGPAVLAKRHLKRGRAAMAERHFSTARRHLERAANYEPLREEAATLMAEAFLHESKPADALYCVNTLLLEQEQLSRGSGKGTAPRSARVRLLRGLAGCMLGRVNAARRELAPISKSQANVDELLAAAQACVMAGDAAGAQQLLEMLESQSVAGSLLGRVKLVRAALYYRLGAWEKALNALPERDICVPADALACDRVRQKLREHLSGAM